MSRALAVVLAGGQGKRMDLLCHELPKPLLPFAGRFRVIDFCLSNCVNSGLLDVAVLSDYRRRSLREYLGDGAPWGLDRRGRLAVLEPRSGSYSGTADAVYQNLSFIEGQGAESVLVLGADHVYRMDYGAMVAQHERTGADVTVAVMPVPIEEAHRFGLADVDDTGRIQAFVEKPRMPQSNLASLGIYVFRREILAERLREDAADRSSPHDFGHAVVPRMVRPGNAFAYRFQGYWRDIGTVESYYRANMELLAESPPFSLDGPWPIYTAEDGLADGQVGNLTGNCLIGPGCIIDGRVENSVVSAGVTIEAEAVVRDSVIMAKCIIGRHSVVDRCILDEGVTVGQFSYIGLGASLVPGNWDITIVGRGATIPPRTTVGRMCKIHPGVGPGDFKDEIVAAGTALSRRASAGSRVPA